tara:strand:- start:8122 stop:8301 length:180 start_codon:yes stop_codon:yes gene_type:complete
MYDITERICPTTILLNISAIGLSMTDVEMTLKILSYTAAVVWTVIKIIKEIKFWNQKIK